MEISLSEIVRDPELQPRQVINHDRVTQYAEDMLAGIAFPPVVVYDDGQRKWLSQGFHRCEAAEQAGWETIDAEIRVGSRQDALWDACGSNREFDTSGLHRSNADKNRAVEMALRARPNLSGPGIARQCGVSHKFVEKVRAQVATVATSDRRTGLDGKSYPANRRGELSIPKVPVRPSEPASSLAILEDEPAAEAGPYSLNPEPEPPRPTSNPTFNQTNDNVDWARWTWNPVTGCEHNCVYCLSPGTPILYADMTWRQIDFVQVGDVLLGFDEYPTPGKTRKLRPSVVEGVWRHGRPVKVIQTESGVVRATDEHLWLSYDGRWRPTRRLRPGQSLRRMPVVIPEVETGAYRVGYIEAMTIGDGTYRYQPGQRSSSTGDPQCYWRVALTDTEPLTRLVHFLGHFGVELDIRAFSSGSSLSRQPMFKVETRSLDNLQAIHKLLTSFPHEESPEYMKGFLAGFFDAEGHSGNTPGKNSLRMYQKDEGVLRRVQDYGRKLGFEFSLEIFDRSCKSLRLVGPLLDRVRFFSVCRPAIARKMASVYGLGLDMEPDRIVSIEDGIVQDVIDIQTSTRTFFANGLATHNCYARDIANRFYPEGFKPVTHWDRLAAPKNTRVPGSADLSNPIDRTAWRNVFVCSMADLFGRWVPDEWVEKVFAACSDNPQWNYLFLTKFPNRYIDLRFPANSWVGTSVDEQKRVPNVEKSFARLDVSVKWLSVEPMQEPIRFKNIGVFDWVVIGGRSRSTGAPEFFPDPHWVADLIADAHKAGCKVYCKPNTDPHGHWANLFREYPDAFGTSPEGAPPCP